ncbi:MAG: trypsin-like peptidase domain-containing protein [Nitrososphaeraceae archaeon]|nr:trypsin-like peptidase domain-containing protein [Nitrososphaeraceae archaeon]MBV9666795.1 trypsin-like peptidase domain-containing protein [Nitrososphaeraceae archaeon]
MQRSNIFSRAAVNITSLAILFTSLITVQTQVMAQTSTAVTAGTPAHTSFHSPINIIFRQVQNSVVQITNEIPISINNLSNPQTQNSTTLGSGFIYDKVEYCGSEQQRPFCIITGHVITNNHVVGDAKIVDVTFSDGNKYIARVIGADIYSDIAVLQIMQNITRPILKPLVIGNSSKLEVGDKVVTISNPFGLGNILTTGIISAMGRVLSPLAESGGYSLPNIIQTDVPLASGSSGGPLLNMQGQVVGMDTAGISAILGGSGIAFAIPSDTLERIVPALIKNGTYIHPYLGLKGGTITSDLTENITGIPAANFKGIYVDTITKNGPADKAGVHGSTTDQYSKKHVGDIIVAIDGHPVVRVDDLISYIDQHKSVGDNLTLTVYRNGHTLDLKATLTARPSLIPFLPIKSAPTQPPIPPPPPPPHP